MSSTLAKFVADFESKILLPVRAKRAASDEILAIQPVPSGTVPDAEWDGTVDGEVCGHGPLAAAVQEFLHWVPVKLEPLEALRLCVSCGDSLANEGEFTCARDCFYGYVTTACVEMERDRIARVPPAGVGTSGAGRLPTQVSLTLPEACWATRADFGRASMELRRLLTRDPHVRFPQTLAKLIVHLGGIQRGMGRLLSQPKEAHDRIAWLVQEGALQLFEWCEPLTVKGHGGAVAEFLAWSLLATERVVILSTVKHLPWRTRLAVATCYAFEDAGKLEAAAKCTVHAMEKVSELRRQEGMDPPIPAHVTDILDAAEGDLRLLNWKYAVLLTATAKRTNASTRGVNPAAAVETAKGSSLSEEDVIALLSEHILLPEERPKAILELLGRARDPRRGSSPLSTGDVHAVCNVAVSLLLASAGPADTVQAENERVSRNERGVDGTEEKDGISPASFALEIDQEMQLLKVMYQLGEVQSWEAIIRQTKQRLRDDEGSVPQSECSAYWFEITLWTGVNRLTTWKDKPEPQPASRGGLKRTPAVATGASSNVGNGGSDANGGAVGVSGDRKEATISGSVAQAEGLSASNGLPAGIEEQALRQILLRPAEMVELPLNGIDAEGVRVNLAPLLAVTYLVRKALFGPYRNILDIIGDSVLDAATSIWKPYMESILRALDLMPIEEEIDRCLLDALLLSLETINACLWMLNADDAALRGTVALRLAIMQADFRGDHEKACQTLRSAIAGIDKHRQEVTSHHLHAAYSITDIHGHGSEDLHSVALARASVTASFHEKLAINTTNECGGAEENVIAGAVNPADPDFHEPAAIHLDLVSTLFRVELLLGRDVACRLMRHQKEKAAAKLAALQNASKRRGGPHTVSKVTFGDSDGKLDTQAGSLALGWKRVSSPGMCGINGVDELETNAVVCVAGAGALPSAAEAVATARRSLLISGVDIPSTASDGVDLQKRDEVERCPGTEARLISEFRRNPYARAVLLTTMARFRTQKGEQKALLMEAVALLRQAKLTEDKLLLALPGDTTNIPAATTGVVPLQLRSIRGEEGERTNINKRSSTKALRAPYLLSRSHTSVELLPVPFSPPTAAKYGSGGDSGDLAVASNATSTRNLDPNLQNRSGDQRSGKYISRKLAKVCIYGKPEGAGTGVSLSNTQYPGLGVPVPFDPETGVCGAMVVRGLTPNESYVFAVAAFDESESLIGGGIGEVCGPVETLNPLPLPLCWALLARTALALGWPSLAGQAAKAVYRELVIVGSSEGCGGVRNVRRGWMGNPLHGQAFRPNALDKCPRAILQAFVQACFVLVETSDKEAMAKAAGAEAVPLEEQVCRLMSLKRILLASEASVLLREWDLVKRCVWRAYHLLLPLLGVAAMGRLLFQALCQLHQCLCLVPKNAWGDATKVVFACVAYQVTVKGCEVGEQSVAKKVLLENGPEMGSENSPGGGMVAIHTVEDEEANRNFHVPQQTALLEIWIESMGLWSGAEVSALRKVLASSPSTAVAHAREETRDDVSVGEQEGRSGPSRASKPEEATEEVLLLARKNPVEAWKLLKEEKYASHPQRARLVCRVCRAALRRGMANQVVFWLDSAVERSGEVENGGGGNELDSAHPTLYSTADLEHLSVKVLAREGTLATLHYLSKMPAEAKKPEAADDGRGAGSIERDDDADMVELVGEGQADDKQAARQRDMQELGNLPPTPAESAQLLWLAEAEHLLGTAFLHRAFACAPGTSLLTDTPTKHGYMTAAWNESVAAISLRAARGRRPWGFGSGPFTEVFPLTSEVAGSSESNGSGNTEEEVVDVMDEQAEAATIQMLEDSGVPWPIIHDDITADMEVGGRVAQEESTSGENGDASSFSVLLSKALIHLARAASRARWGRSWVKTQGACGLLWNSILALWLSPHDFQPANGSQDVTHGATTLQLRENHARIYAKACEALLDAVEAANACNNSNSTRGRGDTVSGGEVTVSEDRSGRGKSRIGDDGRMELRLRKVAPEYTQAGDALDGERPKWKVVALAAIEVEDVGRAARSDVLWYLARLDTVTTSGSEPCTPGWREGSESLPLDARWVSRFVEWVLQGLLRCRCWGMVVKVGTRLLLSTGGVHGTHRTYPLVMHAQRRLCSLASALLKGRETRLEELDEKFLRTQAKKRHRKVLKAVESTRKDEMEHYKAREPLLEAVGDARVRKQIHDHRLGTLLQSRDTCNGTKRIGRRMLDDARVALAEYLAVSAPSQAPMLQMNGAKDVVAKMNALSPRGRGTPFAAAEGVDLDRSLKALVKAYGRAVDVLREKRERELLVEALNDLGDLHALRGRFDLAGRSWTDAIDGLCSTLDAAKHWRPLFGRLRATHPTSGDPSDGGGSLTLALGDWGCLAGGIVVGKLSALCGQANLGGQLDLCLMAAEMFRAPLETSLPFPQRACDYAWYTPETLGSPGLAGVDLWTDDRRLSASTLFGSMMHVQGVLSRAGQFKEAFPVLAVLEHIASRVMLDPLQLAHVKLIRAQCLAEAGFPAEAASALAAVLRGGGVPTTTGNYAGRRVLSPPPLAPPDAPGKGKPAGKAAPIGKKGADGTGGGKKPAASDAPDIPVEGRGLDGSRDELSKSGLPFYGLAAYNNHLPLDHPDNTAAVAWLMGDDSSVEANETAAAEGGDARLSPASVSRHARLLKRGLARADPSLRELHGEKEACTVALTRARLLKVLADCFALSGAGSPSTTEPSGPRVAWENVGEEIVARVRNAADCVLGEVLQVVLKRLSPMAIPHSKSGYAKDGNSETPEELAFDHSGVVVDNGAAAIAAVAAAKHAAATAPDAPGGWIALLAAEALLLRGRLALFDGKLRVCRHHASRGLAILLRHGCDVSSLSNVAGLLPILVGNGAGPAAGGDIGEINQEEQSVTFGNPQDQPWMVIRTWLELRHDLAVVALLQGRTADSVFQIDRGLAEARGVGETVVSKRLRRLQAQAAVAEGELELAVSKCRELAIDYASGPAPALDHAAALRLAAKVRRQQALVCGGNDLEQTLMFLGDAVEALRRANTVLLDSAEGMGWIGTGVLTYAVREDNIMMADARPRLLSALSTSFRDISSQVQDGVPFGLVPADEGDVLAPSVLANLYLPTLSLLLTVRISMVDLIEGIGHHNNGLSSPESCKGSGTLHESIEDTSITATNDQKMESNWVASASDLAEESMALMRHVAHPHPALRAHALLLVGKLRLRRLQELRRSWSLRFRPRFNGASLGPENARANIGEGADSTTPPEEFVQSLQVGARQALTAALRVSFKRGGHEWKLMRDASLSLVMLHGGFSDENVCGVGAGIEGNRDDDVGIGHHRVENDVFKDVERDNRVAAHYLRLSAAIALGRHRLDAEVGDMATEPLPSAVIDAIPRAVLDELAGRSGRGPEDDPRRLDTRGLLHYFRARIRETSLAAAPTDLLSSTVVCQIHTLLYRHFPPYRERCCIDETLLTPPPQATDGSATTAGGRPGSICVQWLWTEPSDPPISNNIVSNMDPATCGTQAGGLYPVRTAVVLLGLEAEGTAEGHGTSSTTARGRTSPMTMIRVKASRALELRRSASQLKLLFSASEGKATVGNATASCLRDRMNRLMDDVSDTLTQGHIPILSAAVGINIESARLATDRSNGGANYVPKVAVKMLADMEGMFDTETGIDVENDELCRLVQASITA